MSWQLQKAARASATRGPRDRAVLLILADRANDQGTDCWPSVESIAADTGYAKRTVRYALRSLEAAGHTTTRLGGGAHQDSSDYYVHPVPAPARFSRQQARRQRRNTQTAAAASSTIPSELPGALSCPAQGQSLPPTGAKDAPHGGKACPKPSEKKKKNNQPTTTRKVWWSFPLLLFRERRKIPPGRRHWRRCSTSVLRKAFPVTPARRALLSGERAAGALTINRFSNGRRSCGIAGIGTRSPRTKTTPRPTDAS